jgi:hypothetical protein
VQLCEPHAGLAGHLPFAGLATQLTDQFVDLPKAGRAEMPGSIAFCTEASHEKPSDFAVQL